MSVKNACWPLLLSIALCVPTFAQEKTANTDTSAEKKTADNESDSNQLSKSEMWKGTLAASKAFRIATNKVLPSMVTIESFAGVRAVQGRIGGIRKKGEGNSTGLIISEDGYIVTSTFNFINNPRFITVYTQDGNQHIAEMKGKDETRKICILKIKDLKQKLPVPEFVNPKDVVIGQWAITVGIGFGDANPAISYGIISAKNRVGQRAIQTDANISPANYGGPLLDITGKVLGICVPLSPRGGGAGAGVEWYDSGIGFAIPLSGTEPLIAKLKQGKTLYPAWLGIQSDTPNEKVKGVRIKSVVAKSPAKTGGIKRKDVITKIDGQPTPDLTELRVQLGRKVSEQQVKITVLREKEELDLNITLGKRPANVPNDVAPPKVQIKPNNPKPPVPNPKDQKKKSSKDKPEPTLPKAPNPNPKSK